LKSSKGKNLNFPAPILGKSIGEKGKKNSGVGKKHENKGEKKFEMPAPKEFGVGKNITEDPEARDGVG